MHLWWANEKIGNMHQFSGLFPDGLYDPGMAMAYIVDCDPCEQVQIFFAVGIPDKTALTSGDGYGESFKGG